MGVAASGQPSAGSPLREVRASKSQPSKRVRFMTCRHRDVRTVMRAGSSEIESEPDSKLDSELDEVAAGVTRDLEVQDLARLAAKP